jgi:acid phosphatase type 7
LLCLLSLTLAACREETPSPEQEDDDPVVVAVGDIADCDTTGDSATAKLVRNIEGTVLTLGDNAYEDGSAEEYARCYDPTWGRFKKSTKPTPGNHEYRTPGASGYFDYFGDAAGDPSKGYYSYDLENWHVVALNSNCEQIGGCSKEAPQVMWLRQDLSTNPKACTLAYFHHPLYTSGEHHPGIPKVRPIWAALYEAGADVILSGHDHNYQRFALQDFLGKADPVQGIRQFVVGTGGGELYEIDDPMVNLEAYNDDTFGVLKLTLRPDGYEWKFVPVAGETFTDSGTAPCQ